MFPLRDNIPSRTTPFVNYALIAACCLAYLGQQSDDTDDVTLRYSMIPARVTHPQDSLTIQQPEFVRTPEGVVQVMREIPLPQAAVPPWATLLTCVFLHGSLMHLLGNMWFLHIFGDNVEDRLGHLGYLFFYLGCGVAASLTHYLTESESLIPTVGASGAIAGVMGAYLLLYPRARVISLVPLFFILQIMVIPAPIFLGLWFLLQLVQGTFAIGDTSAAGVAWWAHIGGFAAGYAVAFVLNSAGRTSSQVTAVRPGTEQAWRFRPR